MKSLFLLLALSLILPLSVEGSNCSQKALRELYQSHLSVALPVPVSFQEFQRAVSQLRSRGNKPKFLEHLKGDYQYVSHGPKPQVKVVSGLHTNEGIDFLKKMRPDIAPDISIKEFPNGMQVASIPEAAISERRLRSAHRKSKVIDGREIIFTEHTLFPKAWSEKEIIEAVEKVRSNRVSLRAVREGATFITGSYKGVKIRIIIREGEIKTAFPMAN